MQKKPENKMRHILCPNSCSYGAVRCFGKPQVRRTVSDIRKSIMASITDCIPIGLSVFDYEYQCLCEKVSCCNIISLVQYLLIISYLVVS